MMMMAKITTMMLMMLSAGHPNTDMYDGWHLGAQAYSFNRFTFFEAVDKTASAGMCWIEAYPGQRVSSELGEVKMLPDMPAAIRQQVKQKLKASGVTLVNFGVTGLPNNEAECRKTFEFAKDMGIKTIVSEPPFEAFDMIDKLCQEYKINVALHNHPKSSRYWHPDTVLKACQGRSKYIGACADTGHWMRSGVNPLEAIKKLEGRIISLHLKDLNEFGVRNAHDLPWGTGKANIKEILTELDRQGFKGVFSIEYEYNWSHSVPEIRKCVDYFNKVGRSMKPTGWKNFLADDLSNMDFQPGGWTYKDNLLTCNKKGDIWSRDKYEDFVLDMEFKVGEKTNSGVFLRAGNHNWLPWIEVQIEDSNGKTKSKHICGGIFDVLEPSENMVKPAGQWNHLTIGAQGHKIAVVLNGEVVVNMDLNDWPEAHKNKDGTPNKFNIAYKDLPRKGYIGLQDHNTDVWYRNVKIMSLED
ncbi:MAG: DUF1080 domain-containing protein [Phycisphaerae bacterium]|nr:DUF1080 domain-containing protein [Phycisphaerae bacterium]